MRIDTKVKDYVVFDLESTGCNVNSDHIIEIGAIRVRNNEMVESYSTLIKCPIHIPEEATEVNHITDDMLTSGLDIAEGLSGFIEFIKDDVLLGHNIESFDIPLVNMHLLKCGKEQLTNNYCDSVIIARSKLSHLASRSLKSLASYYNVSYQGAHRSLQDCAINHAVYQLMMDNPVDPRESNPRKCTVCGNTMKYRSGKYGWFFGCSNYPNCTHTEKL